MKKALFTILFIAYAIIAISVTVLLLSYNEYNCSVIGPYTFYIVKDDSLEGHSIGQLLIIKSTSDKNISVGDSLYFYNVISGDEYQLDNQRLLSKTQSSRYISYTLENGTTYDSSYLIGKEDDTTTINILGGFLAVMESKWGYLFLVVIVSLLLFLQELFELIMEIRYGDKK